MVSNKDLKKLLSKGKDIKGAQVGRAVLSTLVDDVQGKKRHISDEEISKLVDNISNAYEGDVYNSFTNAYASIIDAYNYIESLINNALLSVYNIKNYLTSETSMACMERLRQFSPVTITERQYHRYLTKFNKYIKDIATENKKNTVSVFGYIYDGFADLIENISPEISTEPNQKLRKKYLELTKIVDEYATEPISKETQDFFADLLSKTKHFSMKDPYTYNYYSFLGIKDEETRKRMLELYDDKYLQTEADKEKAIKAFQLKLADLVYEGMAHDLSQEEACNQAFQKLSPRLFWMDDDDDDDDIDITSKTKLDLAHDPVLSYVDDNIEDNPFDAETQQKIIQKVFEEIPEIIQARAQDIIKEYPKMKDFLTITNVDDLTKKVTWNQLAKAGDASYKEKISITKLKEVYSITNVFPKSIKERAESYGFSVYHGSKDEAELKNQEDITKNQLLKDLNETIKGHTHNRIKESYDSIEDFLTKFQAYQLFIKGLIKFTNYKPLDAFINPARYDDFCKEIDHVRTLRNMELGEISKIYPDNEELRANIKKVYPEIDVNKARTKETNVSKVASYLAEILKGDAKPISITFVLNKIAEGLSDEE